MKLATQHIKLEDHIAVEVERRRKGMNMRTSHVAQFQPT